MIKFYEDTKQQTHKNVVTIQKLRGHIVILPLSIRNKSEENHFAEHQIFYPRNISFSTSVKPQTGFGK